MKKNTIVILLLLAVALVSVVSAAPPRGKQGLAPKATQIDNDTYIDANNIFMFVTNHGNFARDLSGVFGLDAGTFFPYTTADRIRSGELNDWVLYASGLWIGGMVGGQTRVAIAEYDDEYVPGPMANGTFQPDIPAYKVYKIYSDSLEDNPNTDWLNWPVDQGAPVDSNGNPDIIGDQMLWAVYNDADPDQHGNNAGETDPLGIEVRQTTFAFDQEPPLGNVIFIRYRIFNKGVNTIDSCYFSLWSDPDLGDAGDDLVGSDTLIGLGYVYNADNDDAGHYGPRPPAVGYDFFQGPVVTTGDPADTARFFGKDSVGAINLGMVSFNKYINGTDPNSAAQTYNYMRGLTASGDPYTYLGDTLLYVHSGDPVQGVGDLDINPADRRFMQSTGPITFAPGDSTEIFAAIIVGQGGDRLSSISVMRFFDQAAQLAFDNDFVVLEPPAKPQPRAFETDGVVSIHWTDVSEEDPGDYPFEGYTVFEGPTLSGPWTRLINYDLVNGVSIIYDSVLNLETGFFETLPVKKGADLGIQRFYQLEQLTNYSERYYRVEAYSFADIPYGAQPRTLTSSSDVIAVTPQPIPAGTEIPDDLNDILTVEHAAGVSGATITPVVVDPFALTGDDYMVTFDSVGVDTIIDDTVVPPDTTFDVIMAWNLFNSTTGDTLVFQELTLTGDLDYEIFDGILVRVADAGGGFASLSVVANANGPLTEPDPGAFDFQGFPTPGEGNPTDAQQVGDGHWGFHTADNGGTCNGGTRGSYDAFLGRVLRGDNAAALGIYDYEMRFTGDTLSPGTEGSYAIRWYQDDHVMWVPFELWRTGIGTPDDPSDDLRLIPYIIDDGDDSTFNLESWGCATDAIHGGSGEHSASSLDNDPWTDWVYWRLPADETPGEAGYLAAEADMLSGTYAGGPNESPTEIMARTVLVNWNGGTEPPFNQGIPEPGTIFRLETGKPVTPADTFTFTAELPNTVASEGALDNIKTVPNPFYLFGDYDPNPGTKVIKFINLPAECTIDIYNLAGDLVQTVEHRLGDPDPSSAVWNATTFNNIPVASGIYVYVVKAPGFGEKIGKMAVFTEVEVLPQF